MKYVIGRYYFDSLFREEANKNFVDDLTKKEPFIDERSYQYALGDFNSEIYEGHTFLRGLFGRMKKSDVTEVYNKETKEFNKSILSGKVDKKLEFLIDHTHHLIFVEYDNVIGPSYFADKFKEIFKHTSSVSNLELDFIFEEKDVYTELNTWSLVEKITFKKLRPSNPSSLDTFEEIEKLIKETNSAKTKIEFHSSEESKDTTIENKGLNTDSILIRQGLALSASGYGEADLVGKKNEQSVQVSTGKFIKKIEINFSEDGALKKITQEIENIQTNEK